MDREQGGQTRRMVRLQHPVRVSRVGNLPSLVRDAQVSPCPLQPRRAREALDVEFGSHVVASRVLSAVAILGSGPRMTWRHLRKDASHRGTRPSFIRAEYSYVKRDGSHDITTSPRRQPASNYLTSRCGWCRDPVAQHEDGNVTMLLFVMRAKIVLLIEINITPYT